MTAFALNPNALKRFRTERGLTLSQLASMVGVAEVTVRTWEAGRYRPGKNSLSVLARELDVPLADLLFSVCPTCDRPLNGGVR